MCGIYLRFIVAFFAVLTAVHPALGWTIAEIADQVQPCTSIGCTGTGPASSTGTLIQFKWNTTTETYQAYGHTSGGGELEAGEIRTTHMGLWGSTAYPEGGSYALGRYKLKILEDGADELFDVTAE